MQCGRLGGPARPYAQGLSAYLVRPRSDSRVYEQNVISPPGLARRMPELRDSPDERTLHLDLRAGIVMIPGALSGLNAQGLLHTEQRAKSNSRNAFEEVHICAREPRGSNVRSRKLLTAERCDRPVAVKANDDLRVIARRPVWKPDAGRYGGQGALNRPE